jgi:hypothetical protein
LEQRQGGEIRSICRDVFENWRPDDDTEEAGPKQRGGTTHEHDARACACKFHNVTHRFCDKVTHRFCNKVTPFLQ